MKIRDITESKLDEKWSQKYKSSINCSHPKGFSQKAHCAGKKKHNEDIEMEMVCPDCGMCETHGDHMMEVKQRLDAKCWKGKHKEGTKIKGGIRVNNCVPNESVEESAERCQQCGMTNCSCAPGKCKCKPIAGWIPNKGFKEAMKESTNDLSRVLQLSGVAPDKELAEEFDLIESIINRLAEHNSVDAEVIWEDLESLTEDELYAFAVTSEPVMESQGIAEGREFGSYYDEKVAQQVFEQDPDITSEDEVLNRAYAIVKADQGNKFARYKFNYDEDFPSDIVSNYFHLKNQGVAESEAWQKANKRDKTDGMSQKAVNTYRREHPGSKLQTAVTTKPSKLKRGSKASKRRSSYCSRSRGQMKMHSISCSKTPDKAICKARRRWNC